mmetsp:Transcript_774/g.1211  ORF Transcript_774/g.1211 Transcript_774/m.1211 type:complete len:250 (+) Transcript_774:116-865(+)|eukprot:CAMPEP_0195304924 /NCGR_PEP_ID=MMETSP0707-20130614/35374_1 /TAXON_ID=33640 /ORGANISM="Asterionellopsis glacialis, Strain CCMP134" /LENGTH=249 /DNA_ID=CAMNT_0040368895 /DNA_START=52 /DNA_END=801 /DNA_ORIENTATION=+
MPPLNEDVSGFSSSLKTTLMASRAKLDAFVEDQKARADAATEAYEQNLIEEQSQIDTHIEALHSVQMERGMKVAGNGVNSESNNESDGGIAKRRQELRDRQCAFENDIESLQKDVQIKETQLEELKRKEIEKKSRAEQARDTKHKVEETKRTTVDDLTRGVVNYKYLGLDFVKAEGNRLRFNFTQIDAGEPLRPFSFILDIDDEDSYVVEDCQPPIADITLLPLLTELNETNDLSPFLRAMRMAFSERV